MNLCLIPDNPRTITAQSSRWQLHHFATSQFAKYYCRHGRDISMGLSKEKQSDLSSLVLLQHIPFQICHVISSAPNEKAFAVTRIISFYNPQKASNAIYYLNEHLFYR